jgi:murein DD-endopeptidase MepM/ murein hydrolase activator NlpD
VAITASAIRTKATGGQQVSTSSYTEGSNTPVSIYSKDGAVFWTSGMSIDCDGQPGSKCNLEADPYFQPNTSWNQSDGKPLKAESLPFVVVPLPSPVWDFRKSGIQGGDLVAMVYGDKYVFGVVGDQGPTKRIGEASYAAAAALGINPDPLRGGVNSGVTYVVFPGVRVQPIESISEANRLGEIKMAAWLGDIQPPVTPPTTTPPVVVPVEDTTQLVVKDSDTVAAICEKYKISIDDLLKQNHLFYVGQVLAVPKLDPYDIGLPVVNSKTPSAVYLQRELKRVGYMDHSVVEASNYGPRTQDSVAAFHNANPQFRDGANTRDVTINRAGWDFLRKMDTNAARVATMKTLAAMKVESPVPGYGVIKPFGVADTRYAGNTHQGDDYIAPEGKPVVAVVSGTVVWANETGGAYGKWLGLRSEDGRDYIYCHLSDFHVSIRKGVAVRAGEILGYVGSTGNATEPHLHFEDRPAGGGYGTGRKPRW